MMFRNFVRTGYTKSLVVIFVAQLSACGGGGGDSAPPASTLPGQASVTWAKPAFREDGTDLPVGEIGGYRVYYGTTPGDYQREIEIPSDGTANGMVTVKNLPVGNTYYFVVTTYDTEGRESLYSSPEVEIKI
ncbi:MAG: fibronectin type III domain-containing protein [Gammaproteobacteria bacterium]|nr:fibronectin type III domain-containing protein [Gammaproteobacteria bacterium]